MTNEMTPEEAAAVEMSKPGKFSLIERLRGRNMPAEVVTIYLDEAAAYELQKLKDEHGSTVVKKRLAELDDKIAELTEVVKASAVDIHMRAVSSIRYDQLIAEVDEVYPLKFEVSENIFTGVKSRTQKADPERDDYFNNLYLAETIEKAVFDGSEDTDINVNWVKEFTGLAPVDGLRRVAEKAWSLRMTSNWMDEIQNEDFSLPS